MNSSLADFDSVCMATALHMMATLRAPPSQYQGLASNEDFKRLLETIRKTPVAMLDPLCQAVAHVAKEVVAIEAGCQQLQWLVAVPVQRKGEMIAS